MSIRKLVILILIFGMNMLVVCHVQKSRFYVPQLLHKRFNAVAYPTAHNAQSFKKSIVQNQDVPIPEQLEAGIRAFKLPVWYDYNNEGKYYACVCHGLSKDMILSLTETQIMDYIPVLIRPSVRKIFRQLSPVASTLTDTFTTIYGQTDQMFGILPFRHCIFDPAAQPLETICAQVKSFLDKNPQDIITLILEDFTHNLPLLAQAFQKTGLIFYAHAQPLSQPWPTLGTMIDHNKRLVVFVKSGDHVPYKQFSWMNPLWDFAWDTKWQFSRARDFLNDQVPNRGKKAYELRTQNPHNKIFIVYHFITPFAGGSKKWARKVNQASILKRRLKELQKKTGHMPNFIQVDFFQYPHNDIFKVINEINGID